VLQDVEATGRRALFVNGNAADPQLRSQVTDTLRRELPRGRHLRVLVHSLAFGSLRPLVASPGEEVTPAQLDMTLTVMAHSLIYWTQDLAHLDLLGPGSRIFAMTSSGGTRVLPSYGPVSAAKAALESHVRQLALELAPRGVAVNALRAGVTDTPALRKIPGHDRLIAQAQARNPGGRLTTPEDVARAVTVLADLGSWVTGNVIGVDGGEDIVG
jgi:enoyl-[acyl-carrier-protein] reductase (NADH)